MSAQERTFHLGNSYQGLVELILPLSDELFLSPMDGWSPRDVVAHLIGWNSLMIEACLSIRAGKPPAYYGDKPNDYSNLNAGFTRKYSSRSKQELLAELKTSLDKLEAFVLALPEEELAADHGVRHYSGSPATVNRIIASLAGDYQVHTQEIREWLKRS
jgi:hypothetical protein